MATLSEWSHENPKLLVFTGAGLSAESGISTFRDADGLWEKHDIDVVANGYTWRDNLDLVRQFYNDRRVGLAAVEANLAHQMVAQWQQQYNTLVLTQNIDDLLERAGCRDVIHLHGKLSEMRCVACGLIWDIGYRAWEENERCDCGSRRGVRPNVVFFNEDADQYQHMYTAFENISSGDCIVIIGTSGQVIAVDQLINSSDCLKILNNLNSSKFISEAIYDHVLLGNATEMCIKIDKLIEAYMGA